MRIPSVPRLLLAAAVAVWIAGCSHNSDRPDRDNPFKNNESGDVDTKTLLTERELRLQADQLYRRARDATEAGDYQAAITRYDQLIAKYPFSDFSTQSEMEKVFALYKSQKADEALSAADRFLRSHPRHPHADYVQYLKGLADFDRDQSLASMIGANSPKRDVANLRRAFEDFALLLQKYPNSRYAGDARRRMLFARNRVADHELSIAKFYYSDRGAYVAAAKRATDILADYPGAPATAEALEILKNSYTRLGLAQPAKDAETLATINPTKLEYPAAPAASLTATVEPPPPGGAPAAGAAKDSGGILNGVSTTLGSGLAAVFDAVGITKADQRQGAAPAGTAAQPQTGTESAAKTGTAAAPVDKSGNPISRTVNGLFGLLVNPGSPPPKRHEEIKLPKSQPSQPNAETAPETPAPAAAAAAPASAASEAPAAPAPAPEPPPQAPAAPLAPPADAAGMQKSPGLMERFAHMFDVFDSTKPNHQHTLVLPKSGSGSGPAPAAAEAAPAAPAPVPAGTPAGTPSAVAAPGASPGFMGRFTHMFDVFDTTKPENQHTLVLPSVTNGGGSAPAAADGTPAASGSKLHMEIGYPEAQPAPAAAAKPADGAAPAAAPATDKPDDKKSDSAK